jgi:FAD/FMN-containing dehydrogenase
MSLKKALLICCVLGSIYVIGTYIYFSAKPFSSYDCPVHIPDTPPIPLEDPAYPGHHFKTINDASCLNETRVYDVIQVKSIEDIRHALRIAREKKLPISIAGVRHSMGGQAFYHDAVVLDMSHFNRIISLDEKNKTLTVESGATWHEIQNYLHPKNFAVKAMQSTDIFTVGGSLSVNAHGMDHTVGGLAKTIRSFTIMFADGTIEEITESENPQLFTAVVGGYGLFGVVLTVTLDITDNVMYTRDTVFIKYRDFPAFFEQVVQENRYELFYAHLSTSPVTFLQDMIIYGYKPMTYTGPFPPLRKISLVNLRRFIINLSKKRWYARLFKWVAEKYIDPAIDALHKNNMLSRNEIMHDSVEYLENVLVNETDILQEYFIPRKQFTNFIDRMRLVLQKHTIPLLNASVRIVEKEENMLTYAPEDMFAIVLYLNQRVTINDLREMELLTRELIDAALDLGGTFFLPYQLYFTNEQLRKAYPTIDAFFALKKIYDPKNLFMNKFYAKYAP